MGNPYLIEGPAFISFSGGRTSGYMLKHILDAHGGTLPDDVHVVFANTGKEMPETLDFVRASGEQWNVRITWLEYRYIPGDGGQKGAHSFEVVSHNSASRNGEPFEHVIRARGGILPNPVMRYCTTEMKIRTMGRYGLSLGYEEFDKVVGLRADEMRRVSSMRARSASSRTRERGERDVLMPLADAGITVRDVKAYWDVAPFDLRLPNVDGTTPMGNCDLCFLKGAATIAGIIRDQPKLAEWWIAMEEAAYAKHGDKLRKLTAAQFRMDRPSYAKMLSMSKQQGDLFFSIDNNTQPCGCHD